jgi:segregation and condensation protein B
MTINHDLRLLEAILFASEKPLSLDDLSARFPKEIDVQALLLSLQSHYKGRGIELVSRDQVWCFRTSQDLASELILEKIVEKKLSKAAIETLAVIAYHQPVTRAEIDEIRGVSLSKGTLDLLFEAGWIKLAGRRKSPGKPMQWKTTTDFLDYFSLNSLDDLPNLDELKASGILEKKSIKTTYGRHSEDHEEEQEEIISSTDP